MLGLVWAVTFLPYQVRYCGDASTIGQVGRMNTITGITHTMMQGDSAVHRRCMLCTLVSYFGWLLWSASSCIS